METNEYRMHQQSPMDTPKPPQPMVYSQQMPKDGGVNFIEKVDLQQPTEGQNPQIFERGPEPAVVVPLQSLGEEPATIACPHCRHRTKTRVDKQDSSMTTICGVVLCLICLPAACLPCLCGWFQDVDHFCTNCGKKVVHRKHDGGNEVIMPLAPDQNVTYYPDANLPTKPAAVH